MRMYYFVFGFLVVCTLMFLTQSGSMYVLHVRKTVSPRAVPLTITPHPLVLPAPARVASVATPSLPAVRVRGDPPRRKAALGFLYDGESYVLQKQLEQSLWFDFVVVSQSSISNRGTPKPFYPMPLAPRSVEIVPIYVTNNSYGMATEEMVWAQETDVRRSIGQNGFKELWKQGRLTDNDIVVVVDVDEVISNKGWNIIHAQLRHNEVKKVNLKWHLYDECWLHERVWPVACALTLRTLRTQYDWNTNAVRGTLISPSSFLTKEPVGIHCSWCKFTVTQFRAKLKHAVELGPQYEKWKRSSDDVISSYMSRGLWLDGKVHGRRVCNPVPPPTSNIITNLLNYGAACQPARTDKLDYNDRTGKFYPPASAKLLQISHSLTLSQNTTAHWKDLPPLSAAPRFASVEFSCFSQTTEDSVLLALLLVVGITQQPRVVEIAAGIGWENNACNLLVGGFGFKGLLFDGNVRNARMARAFFAAHPATARRPPIFITDFVTAETIAATVIRHGFGGEIDVLSIDVDGMDYWFLEALLEGGIRPRVLVVEIQELWGWTGNFTRPYRANHVANGFATMGASLGAFIELGNRFDYLLVGCIKAGFNAFFVRASLGARAYDAQNCFTHWHNNTYYDGKFNRIIENRRQQARNIDWVHVPVLRTKSVSRAVRGADIPELYTSITDFVTPPRKRDAAHPFASASPK